MPVSGYLAQTDSKYHSDQLNCWRPTTFTEWRTGSHRSFFEEGLVIGRDAIYHLPLLGKHILESPGSAYSKLSIQPDRLKVIAARSFLMPQLPPKPKSEAKPSGNKAAELLSSGQAVYISGAKLPDKQVKTPECETAAEEASFERKLRP